VCEDAAHFLGREDDGDVAGEGRALELREPGELYFQDFAVEEEQGRERLVLGGSGDVPVGGEVGEEGGDLLAAEFGGVAQAVEVDVPLDPEKVCLFGAAAIVARGARADEPGRAVWA
jgi:hypothetical protein